MDEKERIEIIKSRLLQNEYFIHPLSDANVKEDMLLILEILKKKDDRITQLEKKSALLSQQVSELIQEIENVKGDFGRQR